jgi:hypothetical protein
MTLRRVNNYFKRHKFLLCLLVFATCGVFYAHSQAFWGDRDWTGYFYGHQQTSGLPVINGGVPYSLNSASEYVSYIRGLYNSSDAQKHTAGAYIILVMMGYAPDVSKSKVEDTVTIGGRTDTVMNIWSDMIMQFGQDNLIDYHWTTPDTFSCQNTFYQPTYNDVADYDDCAGTRGQDSIAFFHPEDPSKPVFVLKRLCGNPIGRQGGVPIPNQTPLGSLQVCINNGLKTYSIKGYDPDHPGSTVAFKVVHFSNDTYDFQGTTTRNTATNGTYSGFYPGRAYRLMVKDLDDSDYYDIDPAVTYPTNCGAQPPAQNCSTFTWTMQSHSKYKFSVFAVANADPAYNTAYANGSGNHTFAATSQWASYPAAQPVEQDSATSGDTDVAYSHNYPAPSAAGWFVLVERWGHESNDTWTYHFGVIRSFDCYSATVTDDSGACTISFDTLPGTSNGVIAGSDFMAHAVVRNTGRATLPSNFGGNFLTLTGNGDFPIDVGKPTPLTNVGAAIMPGVSYPIDFQLKAPADINNYNLSGYPDYWGRMQLGAACGVNVAVYQPFNVGVSSSTVLDSYERPTFVKYQSWLIHNSGPSVDIPVLVSTYSKDGAAQDSFSGNKTSNPPDGNKDYVLDNTVSPNPFVAGTNFCTSITISSQTGYRGPGGSGDRVLNNDSTNHSECSRVHNSPYVHVFNSDASAGGGFGKSCVQASGGINAYTKTTGTQPAGSGVQIGALSIGAVNGFNSASLHTSPPAGSSGLTFANETVSPPSGDAPYLGGNLGSNHCVTDYYSKKPDSTPINSDNDQDISTLTGPTEFQPVGGVLTLNSLGDARIGNGKNISLFVDGDVVIKHNIIYANGDVPGGFGGIQDVPSVYIIAKGNIYIDPGVKQLDGLYVAQPTDTAGTNKGIIYTCASGTTPYDDPSLLGNWLEDCRSQMVVNGSFVAQHVHLLRTFGSIRDSGQYPGEHLFGRSSLTCSDSGGTSLGDCAAEIFNFDPTIYLAEPAITPLGGPTTGTYQYITSLSPVL